MHKSYHAASYAKENSCAAQTDASGYCIIQNFFVTLRSDSLPQIYNYSIMSS